MRNKLYLAMILSILLGACGETTTGSSLLSNADHEEGLKEGEVITLEDALKDTVKVSVELPSGEKESIRIPEMKDSETVTDYAKHVFYTLQLDLGMIVIPNDISAGIGVQTANKKLQIEAFVGLSALRAITGGGFNVIYGSRVRVAPFGKTKNGNLWFIEYEIQDVTALGREDGLYEEHGQIGIGVETKKGMLFKLAVGKDTHHAWDN